MASTRLLVLLIVVLFSIVAAQAARDHLTVTITESGANDGTFQLACRPAGGNHPNAEKACSQLDQAALAGVDIFAPTPTNSMCSMMYGGPERAVVSGVWDEKPLDATFKRTNGCEISRWNSLSEIFRTTKN